MREYFNPPPVLIEWTLNSLRALRGDRVIELPLDRAPNGKLTAACREKTLAVLRDFVGRKQWQPRFRALCGLGSHGISLRKISLPLTRDDELKGVLRLQIENEFPLSPDDLAWGWQEVSRDTAKRHVVVAAIRKETILDYSQFLSDAGLDAEFTVAAFARLALCPDPAGSPAILEVGSQYSELSWFEKGVPLGLKLFPADSDLTAVIPNLIAGRTLYVSGTAPALDEVYSRLASRLDVRRLEVSGDKSSALLGLQKSQAEKTHALRLHWRTAPAKTRFNLPQLDFSSIDTRQWLTRGAVLLGILILLPFAETLLLKPLLAHRLETLKAERQKFISVVQPELHFLQAYRQGQPPYLDALYVFAQAAPPGFHMDSLTINQQGNITLKASLQSAQQVMDFRSKLIASGFFANISVEEQTPVHGQPKIGVRMSAQWKSAAARPLIKVSPPADESAKPGNTAGVAAQSHKPLPPQT